MTPPKKYRRKRLTPAQREARAKAKAEYKAEIKAHRDAVRAMASRVRADSEYRTARNAAAKARRALRGWVERYVLLLLDLHTQPDTRKRAHVDVLTSAERFRYAQTELSRTEARVRARLLGEVRK